MAIIHRATLEPTKAELVAAWLPTQTWFDGPADVATPVGAYRFDDPDGEVGIESHLFEVGGRLVHVPLTYRGAPLDGAEESLVGTMEHSVLGTRWVYDGPADPVYVAELTRVVSEGDQQVRMWVETPEGDRVEREPTMRVRGSGGDPQDAGVVVVRWPAPGADAPARAVLTGTWAGQDEPVALAYLG
ncbi:CG0192-related protein [Cellulomonas pakistanensis]|uniref:Maltokinase N-terminal cap domain-containing protein n=1 Tax=Cellulomonas pakistanensis TaxID=992287 RepID=A0A919U730_9CELL|nr:hypothetical protein [Cellulomonas pakistanensis]GIG36880.1 hypothetical protein Cpa01nite_22610 [Cellulomonas pakistanensis]